MLAYATVLVWLYQWKSTPRHEPIVPNYFIYNTFGGIGCDAINTNGAWIHSVPCACHPDQMPYVNRGISPEDELILKRLRAGKTAYEEP